MRPLEELYFEWLYRQVAEEYTSRARTHQSLLRQLHNTEFVWTVPNDDNRVEDGVQLRYEFVEDADLYVDQDWLEIGCSMLEMLLGLSRRLSFEAEGEPRDWFWELLDNLKISGLTDSKYNFHAERMVENVLDKVIWRTYDRKGRGGLFPLSHPREDQRKVELWVQLNAYLLERE